MKLELIPLTESDVVQYKAMVQEAFQYGYEGEFGRTDDIILPEKDIDQSLNAKNSFAYKAVFDGAIVGGAIVTIEEKTQHNNLDFLFVKYGEQNKGIGKIIWFEIEKLHSDTKVWKTCTPYFDKRNIHFYVNVCGFHIVAFFNKKHPMPDTPKDFIGDGSESMFELIKRM